MCIRVFHITPKVCYTFFTYLLIEKLERSSLYLAFVWLINFPELFYNSVVETSNENNFFANKRRLKI